MVLWPGDQSDTLDQANLQGFSSRFDIVSSIFDTVSAIFDIVSSIFDTVSAIFDTVSSIFDKHLACKNQMKHKASKKIQ
ncbi:hypothetical protein ENBRE01_1470 [Enteropsectra breve]|nr:hypothetical protein ENBRE01_1470 [Enteropsectra breve]